MNDYGFALEDYANDLEECITLAARFLNQGCLSYFLGAGASKALELPSWHELIIEMCKELFLGEDFSTVSKEDTTKLKILTDRIKKKVGSTPDYLQLVKEHLYKNTKFDFELAKKELLIALTSLIIGKARGNVTSILTLNFDSVLEWYLKINGLTLNITTKDQLLKKSVDVDIIHIHGYLPHDDEYGIISDSIVMSKKEFEDWIRNPSFERDLMEDFFRRFIFLSIGVSVESLMHDIALHLRAVNNWYDREKITRSKPYGIAFLTDCTKEQEEELIEHGIIPCIIVRDKIPLAVFQIAQKATQK